MKIGVIGCGRWGSFIGWYLHKIGHEVVLYGRSGSERMRTLKETRHNGRLRLSEEIVLTHSLAQVLAQELLVISIGAQGLRQLMEEIRPRERPRKTWILCMKGLEIGTGKRLTEIMGEYTEDPVGVWIGPGHVQEFVQGIPNCMVIDSDHPEVKEEVVGAFSSDLIRFYYGTDLIGNELGAAAKNVIGIAAGMLDGLSRSSLKGALMSRGTREIARLIRAMGGDERSAYGLCHLGDYEATVFSQYSHNRRYGELLVRGEAFRNLAEGHDTVKGLLLLSERCGCTMPICTAVDQVIYRGADPLETLEGLFSRSLKKEF